MERRSFWQRNDLSLLFLLSIFMNGFETGGYQAALLYIGQEFDLSIGQQGILASVQLFATMIAPLLLGPLADRIGKKIMLVLFTATRVLSAAVIMLATESLLLPWAFLRLALPAALSSMSRLPACRMLIR